MSEFRRLHAEDITLMEKMDTGIENDYVLRIFPKLTEGNNHLFGLFVEEQLAILGGFTIFKNKYAMLGRLRSDLRFRGKNLATQFNEQLIEKAFKMKEIAWVGANTKEDNLPANRVLQKLGLTKQIALHGAVTENLTSLFTRDDCWQEITSLEKKKDLVNMHLINKQFIFPYECYYPFPSSKELFSEEGLNSWGFYEDKQQARFFIMKTDQKKHVYLHIIYPWNDLHMQEGLWETVHTHYLKLAEKSEEEVYVWIDLTKEDVKNLPENHPFTLPSAWGLYSMTREGFEENAT